jgi:hypothetical protein
VCIKNQTSVQVMPLRSELSVFMSSLEPLTRSHTVCYKCMLFSLSTRPEAYDLTLLESNLHSEQHQPWTACTNATPNDSSSYQMISNSADLKAFLHPHSKHSFSPPSRFLFSSLLLTPTTTNIPDAKHCNPNLNSTARIPPVLPLPRHYTFLSPLQSYLSNVAGAAKKFQQLAQLCSTANPLSILPHFYQPPAFLWTSCLFDFPRPNSHRPPRSPPPSVRF